MAPDGVSLAARPVTRRGSRAAPDVWREPPVVQTDAFPSRKRRASSSSRACTGTLRKKTSWKQRGCTFKIENQKNGWKNVAVCHEHSGNPLFSPVQAAGRRHCYIRKYGQEKTYLSAYWVDGKRCDVSRDDVSEAI